MIALLPLLLINNANANADTILQEVKIEGGTVGSSSMYSQTSQWHPRNAFNELAPANHCWHSGKGDKGQGESQAFPHLIWYDFKTAFIPAQVSFRARIGPGCGDNGFWCGATKWKFIGTNDPECGRYSQWTTLCEDLSGKNFERTGQSKSCTVDDGMRKAFRCLGISVLDSSWYNYPEVSVAGIKMWRKIF